MTQDIQRHLTYRHNACSCVCIQVVLVWNAPSGNSKLTALAKQIWRVGAEQMSQAGALPLVHSVWVCFQTGSTNRVLGDAWSLLHGPEFVWQVGVHSHNAWHTRAVGSIVGRHRQRQV